ncbi:hypothetical protein [Paracoccus sp. 22332]|uniref:hypothetical protein n=1 Tax=Paracoccus sp. 22332 TaxID=3453913 RepID=UPI003F86BE3C
MAAFIVCRMEPVGAGGRKARTVATPAKADIFRAKVEFISFYSPKRAIKSQLAFV